jgi:hypothetical protein
LDPLTLGDALTNSVDDILCEREDLRVVKDSPIPLRRAVDLAVRPTLATVRRGKESLAIGQVHFPLRITRKRDRVGTDLLPTERIEIPRFVTT